jgi:poly(A) polymerase
LLLGKKPKDFDIVTNATPTQLRKLFSNSRVIGRRFKLVHVVFRGGKVIEVSTFRSLPEHRLDSSLESDDMYLKRDNIFGTPKEDVARRDFTINSLYFDPRNESIIDYTGGFEDMKNQRINVIGDPDISFKEDPVRMLRAAKFAPLLGFSMHSACAKGIRKNRFEIAKANSNRLLEEYFKIFRTGKSAKIFGSMYETGLLETLMPSAIAASLERSEQDVSFEETPLGRRLSIADRMLAEREDLTVDIYLALLFCDLVEDVFAVDRWKREEHIAEYVKSRLDEACNEMKLPGRDRSRLLQVFISQIRFRSETDGRRKNRRTDAFREKVYFFEAFMVFKIHSLAEADDEAVQRAMFWEIGPRSRPPESHRMISLFYNPARHRRIDREDFREDREHGASGRDSSRNGGRGRQRGDSPGRSSSERSSQGRPSRRADEGLSEEETTEAAPARRPASRKENAVRESSVKETSDRAPTDVGAPEPGVTDTGATAKEGAAKEGRRNRRRRGRGRKKPAGPQPEQPETQES